MKIGYLSTTPVKLEKGDLIAIKNGNIYIRPKKEKNKVYISGVFDLNNLEKEILVNSAGDISQEHLRPKDLEWKKYKPKN